MRMTMAAALALWFAAPAMAQVAPAPAAVVAQRYVAEGKLPGLVVTIGRGDAAPTVIAAGALSADPGAAPVTGDSLWRIYSMTKPVTGIAAMMLVEDGKLKLDQPISDFIPAFKQMKVLVDPAKSLEARAAKTPITVRHLLTHTAGLGYTLVTTGPLADEYNRLGIVPAAFNAAMEQGVRPTRPATLQAFANSVATLPLIAEPGARWSYSISLDLLGRVIEVASGMPFDAFLRTRIFDPLGMRSTWFTVPPSEAGRMATNYLYIGQNRIVADPGPGSLWQRPPSFPYGGAGLVSSALDYDRFLHMLLNEGRLDGVRVMKPATVRLAMSNLLPAGAETSALQAVSQIDGRLGFGAGGSLYLEDGPGGGGKGLFGWGGAATTLGWVDPKNRLRGTLMTNFMPSEHWPIREEVTRALYAGR